MVTRLRARIIFLVLCLAWSYIARASECEDLFAKPLIPAGIIQLQDPILQLKQSAHATYTTSLPLIDWHPDLPATPEQLIARHKLANASLVHIRNDLESMLNFFNRVHEMSSQVEQEALDRIAKLRAFREGLPEDMANYQITGRSKFFNSRPPSITKFYVQQLDLETNFVQLMEAMKLPDLVRSLRKTPNVLLSPDIQLFLQKITLDGVDHLIRQTVTKAKNPQGLEEDRALSIMGALTHTLPGFFPGQMNLFDRTSDKVSIKTNPSVLYAMLRELIRNATVATELRHPHVEPENWELRIATTRIRLESTGDARIEIEDFGDPKELTEHKATGQSSTNESGFGIGRLRATLLAGFLDYEITWLPKSDGSGSIVSILIPSRFVVKK